MKCECTPKECLCEAITASIVHHLVTSNFTIEAVIQLYGLVMVFAFCSVAYDTFTTNILKFLVL